MGFDWKVRINANASYDPDRYRIWSDDGLVRNVYSGKSPIGVDLLSAQPAICLGLTDASNAGGISNVRNKLYAWIQ